MWVGLTDSAAAAWFVHHLLYLTVVYLWTLHEPATLLSAFSRLILCEYLYFSFLPFVILLPSCKRRPSSSNPHYFTTSLISFSPSLSLLSVLLFSPFLPLPLLHPSPHSRSDAMPLCRESRGCRLTEPQRKV